MSIQGPSKISNGVGGKIFIGVGLVGLALASFAFFASRQEPLDSRLSAEERYSLAAANGEDITKTSEHIRLFSLFQTALIDPVAKKVPWMPAGPPYRFTKPFNILVAGIPGKGNPAPNLTDTVMVAHVDPGREMVHVFSLPRDLLVQEPGTPYYTRLNGLYERGGITSLYLKAEDITGLEITRYLVIDLEAVHEIVDALGGVNVYVEKDIYDPRFPGNAFSYEIFSLEAGWRFLDGRTATRYIRTRNDAEGDFGRMRRQQLFAEALKEKIAGLSVFWDIPTFLKIFDSVAAHVQTNMHTNEFLRLLKWSEELERSNTIIAPLDADPDKNMFTTGDFWFGAERASVVKPLEGIEQYEAVRAYVQNVIE